ncbi:DUF4124 domain-containing protein [Thioalkalicoccus limnaeus]|uniref:DUF4124 domain-containing protein n=1 Tax=Thioalkalicoccus limnaeus TaxID=120681 RepID=A0ABV4BED7_9GAMM
MDRKFALVGLVAGIALVVQAAPIYKCEDALGHILYQDRPCRAASHDREIDDSTYSVTGRGGLTEPEWEAYQRLRDERTARVQARTDAGRAQQDAGIGYQDQLRLRELRMRRRAIHEALARGSQPVEQRGQLRRELSEIDRLEEAILTRGR